MVLAASLVNAANRPIPEVVNVKIFAHPQASTLELLVRLPLAAVKDIQFPTRSDGDTLDLVSLKTMLPGVAKYQIASLFSIEDHNRPLPPAKVTDTRISISADQSFDSYAGALAAFRAADLPADEKVFWQQVWFDMRFVYTLPEGEPRLTMTPQVADLGVRVVTSLTSLDKDGNGRTLLFEGNPGLLYLQPRWTDAIRQFLGHGGRLVFSGANFLLLLFCLAMPFRRHGLFFPVLLAWGAGFILALNLAAAGLTPRAIWFDPLVATVSTLFVLLAALSNVVGRVTPRRRGLLALGAGIAFGFLGAARLGELQQFGAPHVFVSALAFGTGAVAAAAAAVGVLVPASTLLFSYARVEPIERAIVAALAADTAWGWLTVNWTQLRRVPIELRFDATTLPWAMRALAAGVLLGGLLWLFNEWLKSRRFADEELAATATREPIS